MRMSYPCFIPVFSQYSDLYGFRTTVYCPFNLFVFQQKIAVLFLFNLTRACFMKAALPQLLHSACGDMAAILSLHYMFICMLKRIFRTKKHLQTSVHQCMSQTCIRRIEFHFYLLRPFKERWLPGCAVWPLVSKQLGDMIICSASLTACTLPVSSVLPASVRGLSEAMLWHTVQTIKTLWAHLWLGLWASKEHHVGP